MDEVPVRLKDSERADDSDPLEQLVAEVDSFDRKVESLDKFKLELYQ